MPMRVPYHHFVIRMIWADARERHLLHVIDVNFPSHDEWLRKRFHILETGDFAPIMHRHPCSVQVEMGWYQGCRQPR